MLIYGIDKSHARHRKKRTNESVLLALAFLMGGFGAVAGMIIFNHKTNKNKFVFLVPIAAVLNLAALFAVTYIIQRGGIF